MDSTFIEDTLFEQAARWHLRLSESADPDIWQAYQTWLADDLRRACAMAEAEALLGRLRLPAVEVIRENLARETAEAAAPRPPRRLRWRPYAMAACLALVALGAWHGSEDRLRGDTVTGIGEVRTMRLADGSIITLNTDTAVRVALGPHDRRVRLDRGEAYFEVAHDPSRPFVVESVAGTARVLGTVFDVKLQGDRARVSVNEGHVAVANAQGTAKTVLGAGQSAWLGRKGLQPGSTRDADARAAWRRGQLVFFRTPLAEVLGELDRYRAGTVYVRGDTLRQLPVSGVFETATPDASLDLLVSTLHLRTLRAGPWLTVVY